MVFKVIRKYTFSKESNVVLEVFFKGRQKTEPQNSNNERLKRWRKTSVKDWERVTKVGKKRMCGVLKAKSKNSFALFTYFIFILFSVEESERYANTNESSKITKNWILDLTP